jgi:hypothetical protein
MQPLEIGHAGVVTADRLAVEHGRARPQLGGSGGDQRISVGPIVAAAREQPDAIADLSDDQPVTVMLDLVNPLRTDGRL